MPIAVAPSTGAPPKSLTTMFAACSWLTGRAGKSTQRLAVRSGAGVGARVGAGAAQADTSNAMSKSRAKRSEATITDPSSA
ncbi:MAG: hypothetical protein FJ030_03600 [Chloroflexi bacterium]|nr:hypothetical protein [Chloroflexota bacterium]